MPSCCCSPGLGVRAGEVVGLSLDDIDWSTGQITIRGKGGKIGPTAVGRRRGAALPLIYVTTARGRPPAACSFATGLPLVGFGKLIDDLLAR